MSNNSNHFLTNLIARNAQKLQMIQFSAKTVYASFVSHAMIIIAQNARKKLTFFATFFPDSEKIYMKTSIIRAVLVRHAINLATQ